MAEANLALNLLLRDNASAGLASFARSILTSNGSITQMGAAAGGAAAAFAIFAGGTMMALNAAEDLEFAMAKVKMRVQGATDVLPEMTRQIQLVAKNTMFSATDIAGAYETLGSEAFTAQQILGGLGEQSAYLAQVMGVDASMGAQVLGSALHLFNYEGLSAKQTADLLAGGFLNGIRSADDMQRALNQLGGAGATLKVHLQDMIVTLDLLGQAGMDAGMAATSLKYFLTNLANPTGKAAKELSAMGVAIVDKTNPAVKQLIDLVFHLGGKAAEAATTFDGSITSLQDLYKEAQKARLVNPDEAFNVWAARLHLLNSELFDAQGNFTGMGDALLVLKKHLDATYGDNDQAKLAAIATIFNVRASQGTMILETMNNLAQKYQQTWDRVGATSAEAKSAELMNTLKGAVDALKDTFISFMAAVGTPWLNSLKDMALHLNDLIGELQSTHPEVLKFLAILLPVGALVTGLALGVGALTAAFTFLGPALVPLLAAFGIAMAGSVVLAAIATAFSSAGVDAGGFGTTLDHVRDALGRILHPGEQTADKVQKLKSKTKEANDELLTMDDRLKNVQKKLDDLDAQLDTTADSQAKQTSAVDDAIDSFSKWIEQVELRAKPALDKLSAVLIYVAGVWNRTWPSIAAVASDAMQMVVYNVMATLDTLGGAVLVAMDILNGNWGQAWDDIVASQGAALSHMKKGHDAWDKMLSDGEKMGRDFGKALVDSFGDVERAETKVTDKTKSAGHAISESLHGAAESVHSSMSSAAASAESGGSKVESAIKGHFAAAQSSASTHMAGVTTGIRSQQEPAGAAATGIGTTVQSHILAFLGKSHSWGAEIGQNLASGLRSQIGNVASAAGALAAAIWSYLHHSEPETGPLKGDSTWGAEFAENLALGMHSRVGMVSTAATRIASAMAFTAPVGLAGASSSAGRGGVTHIHVHVGSREVANVIMDDFSRQFRANGGSRILK
jgi:hypothetical protein